MKSDSAGWPHQALILAGGGHTHALVLRRWAMAGPPPELSVVLVNRSSATLYSGMIPGLIGGQYAPEDCSIDLRRLTQAAGVGFIAAEIVGLDPERRLLFLQDRPPLRWDLLSLDVGAVTAPATEVDGTPLPDLSTALPIKPLEAFLEWWDTAKEESEGISIVGSGAAALEVSLAMAGLGRRRGHTRRIELVQRAGQGRSGLHQDLEQAGIVPSPRPSTSTTSILCTGSRTPAWIAATGLPCDAVHGRLLTASTLEVLGHPGLFAAGDCAQISGNPRPPSGVWAVRAATPLAQNLERWASGRPLLPWHPPRRSLQLLGDGGAITGKPRAKAQWGPWSTPFHPWLWKLKQAIDHRFVDRFKALPSAPMGAARPASTSHEPMACHGCAAKLPAAPLAEALASLQGSFSPGGDPAAPASSEDAHRLLVAADGQTWWQSVDGFPALVSDHWLNGRLSALHACSDLWASGAVVRSALAVVSLARQAETLQAEMLSQLLAGIRSVLDPLGAALLGGHTLQAVGPDAVTAPPVVVLTVNGSAPAERSWTKGGLQLGDALILTRPIGCGVLFAAAMAGDAEPEWIDAALMVMQQSQAPLVDLLARHRCHACTDITGFGLLGHLGEMVEAFQLTAPFGPELRVELEPASIPVLDGALACLNKGLASSLAPANRRSFKLLEPHGPIRLLGHTSAERLELLVDPQTCGPLLAALPARSVEPLLEELHRAGFPLARRIGSVTC